VRTTLLGLLVVFGAGSSWAAAPWPEFRGPDGQGHADARNLPVTWSEQENVAWKTAIPGKGWSTPAISDKCLWLTTALDDGHDLRAICVDRQSGQIVHDVPVFKVSQPPELHATNSHASPSPVLDEDRVYVCFGTNGVACLNADTGEVLWTNTELQCDHEVGPGSSPIIHGDLLIVNCDGIDERYVAALDKHSGSLAWMVERSQPIDKAASQKKAFSTPLIIKSGSRDVAISQGAEQLSAYDPATGEEVWLVKFDGFSNVPRPVFGHGMLYVSTGYMKAELLAVRVDGKGDVTDSHIAWRYSKQVPTKPSPLLVGDMLYLFSDAGVATCLNARTGEEVWKERLGGKYSASPILADGRIHIGNEDGQMLVIKPGKRFELLATNTLEGSFMASPAAAGDSLYLRTDTHLYRIKK
jgi:outer membrane protein assembly factor BamB